MGSQSNASRHALSLRAFAFVLVLFLAPRSRKEEEDDDDEEEDGGGGVRYGAVVSTQSAPEAVEARS
jgi:hypothetical protein